MAFKASALRIFAFIRINESSGKRGAQGTTASRSAAAAAPRLRPVAPRSRSATAAGRSRVAAAAGAPSVLPVVAIDRRASPAEAPSSRPGPDGRRRSGLRRICSCLPTLSSPPVLPAPPLPAPVVKLKMKRNGEIERFWKHLKWVRLKVEVG
nr:uncharacterized protein LOC123494443 [Aegilops tauschii subsp. strangulata]XP_045086244.1 uncharacterized protein LOC123494444 [Aegilops tauschii subsp. strangulata]